MCKAAAFGDLDSVITLSADNPEALNQPDEQGYTPLQWASLNNRCNIIDYLVDHNTDVDAVDSTGQTALHWSVVRASDSALEKLLQAGASLGLADSKGYTVLHVAAQYGQTGTIYRLVVRWNVNPSGIDLDGRSALHWAAYKGHTDTVKLLIALGVPVNLQDNEGCTPLHWAAIRGNAESCTTLIYGGAGESLEMQDATGATPSQVALEKGHRLLGINLAEEGLKHKVKRANTKQRPGLVIKIRKLHLSPIVWGLVIGLLIILYAAVLYNPRLPQLDNNWMYSGTWICYISAILGLFFLYKTTNADPGFLPEGDIAPLLNHTASKRGGSVSKSAVIDNAALWKGQWNQICVSCKIVRPLRAKHCSVMNRCIECFDHYCPWVGNAVAKGNRHYFLIFLWSELIALISSACLAIAKVHAAATAAMRLGTSPGMPLVAPIVFLVFDMFLLISVAAITLAQSNQTSNNITTNEAVNWHKYTHLHGHHGEFRNPFDNGWRANCSETCNPLRTPMAPFVIQDEEQSGTELSPLLMNKQCRHKH